jgi:hypothetical protein
MRIHFILFGILKKNFTVFFFSFLQKLIESYNGNLPIELVEFLELIETNNKNIW